MYVIPIKIYTLKKYSKFFNKILIETKIHSVTLFICIYIYIHIYIYISYLHF